MYPLALDGSADQDDPAGVFRLRGRRGRRRSPARRHPAVPDRDAARLLDDFTATCWNQQTSPSSHFTQSTICSRLTDDGRVSISGRTLIRTTGGERAEERLADDAALLGAYREHFGIELARAPSFPEV
jgi:N-hydroxyarylamine O-acetyltransferase